MITHRFSQIFSNEDGSMGGFRPTDSISVAEHATVAVPAGGFTADSPEMIGLELKGDVLGNHGQVKFAGVFAMSVVDAGMIAGALANTMQRLGTDTAEKDFKVGFHMGMTGKTFEEVGAELEAEEAAAAAEKAE